MTATPRFAWYSNVIVASRWLARARCTGLLLSVAASLYGCAGETPVSPEVPAVPASASSLAFRTSPANVMAGNPQMVEVVVRDAQGNEVNTSTRTITLALGANPAGGVLQGTLVKDADNGVASFPGLTIVKAGSGYSITASSPGLTSATSSPFNISPAPFAQLVFASQPANVPVGVVMALQVILRDFFGNTVTSATNSVTVSSASASQAKLLGNTTVNAIDGVATFSLTVDRPGSVSLLAISGQRRVNSEVFNATLTFRSVSTGNGHSCGTAVEGSTFCWGVNDYLGSPLPYSPTGTWSPVPVSGSHNLTSVRAGPTHTCGLDASGKAVCWGPNYEGQLGDGSTTNSVTPVAVSGNIAFAGLSIGSSFTCGWTSSGAGYCWGLGTKGQLGNGTTASSSTPQPVSGGLAFRSVSAGEDYACGVTLANQAYCWGTNAWGQLGNGSTDPSSVPVAVAGGLLLAEVSAASVYACGVTTAGAAYCWGVNVYGELGNGTIDNSTVPVAVAGGLTFSSIDAGWRHVCGLVSGKAYCWGYGIRGELGTGSMESERTPAPVYGGYSFSSIDAGGQHTCGLTTDQVAYCWGTNGSGELGSYTYGVAQPTPLRVTQ